MGLPLTTAGVRGQRAQLKGSKMAGDPSAGQLLKSFLDDVRDDVRDAEVERILSCFRLNPFEHLNLRFDATDADVTRAYRHISLMVHPDKCKHERAKEAF